MPTLSFSKKQLTIAVQELYLKELKRLWLSHQIFLPVKYDLQKTALGAAQILELDSTYINRICESEDVLDLARNKAYELFKQRYRVRTSITDKQQIKNVVAFVVKKFIHLNKGKIISHNKKRAWEQIELNIELKIAAPGECGLQVLGKAFTAKELKEFIKQVEEGYI